MMKMRFVTFGSLFALVALLFLAYGANQANASPFVPTLATCLGTQGVTSGIPCSNTNGTGANANINQTYSWGVSSPHAPYINCDATCTANRSSPESFFQLTPADFTIPSNTGCSLANTGACAFPMGTPTGTALAWTTFGLLNNACQTNVPVAFPFAGGAFASTPLENASTDPTDSIAPGANFANLTAGLPGVPAGAQHWNTLLGALQAAGLLPAISPLERQVATDEIPGTGGSPFPPPHGTAVWLDILTYAPGDFPGIPAALGYVSLTVIENFNPAAPPTPSLITDTCGLWTTTTEFGLAGPPLAPVSAHRTNPATPGTKLFAMLSRSNRDADNDGFVNQNDTCPFAPNVGSPLDLSAQYPTAGDGSESPADGIDAACDPNPNTFDGADADAATGFGTNPGGPGDSFLNRGDNCPLVNNPTQSDLLEVGPTYTTPGVNAVGAALADPSWWARVGPQPVDAGPANDGIGDACDVNPTVADGHYHELLTLSPVCVFDASNPTNPAWLDSDGDGYCNGTESVLGSNPGDPASTPESLLIPTTCSDGKNNDLLGGTDLGDAKCQEPNHDLAIKKVNGGAQICGTFSNTVDYVAVLNNNGPAASDAGQIGIFVQPVPGILDANGHTSGSGPAVTSVSGGTVTVSGPINDKLGAPTSNTDVDWLTKAVVTGINNGSSTTVHFSVTYPPCTSPVTTSSGVDYLVTVDLCHGDDIAPLGLFGQGACEAPGDGHQDRLNTGNDAPVTILVNDLSK